MGRELIKRNRQVVLLDGTRSEDKGLDAILLLLLEVLHRDENNIAGVEKFTLRETKIHHCIGCFNCWTRTPGICIHTDRGVDILQAILKSDIVILFTPVVFGGYSSELKKIMDRLLPTTVPFFKKAYGETHHPSRYSKLPRFITIGVCSTVQNNFARCFKILAGRNAANGNWDYAVEVVNSIHSSAQLSSQFQRLFRKADKMGPGLPRYNELALLQKNIKPTSKISRGNRKALLIVGSPKIKSPSTSSMLGVYLAERLEKYGWKVDSLTLGANLLHKKGQDDLCSAMDKADLLLIVFPLYIDALPFLLTKAFEVIYFHREKVKNKQPKNLLAIVNNGFPEPHQNAVALSICYNFAAQCGIHWAGGLPLGAGEALCGGQPLTSGFKRHRSCGWIWHPPRRHLIRALNITALSLTQGKPIPEKAVQLTARSPIPFTPFALWAWLVIQLGRLLWKKEASENGIREVDMLDKPYGRIISGS
ncbi:MAG: flavodoxin family protein [Candidatus Electrothrix aestuarii]|uniref:Flavodoxin family protein n=1 Tax=Candidatus Electrothrix aestuarii TaxID=3062594 RepID=A0AAU8LPV3_9BACT|nr:flavodoxin family protein [Candidatus Electrothrix aestuarii]